MMNQDIPTEALLQYIVKERDKYKDKLEQLIPYTKSLEKQYDELKKAVGAEDRNSVWGRVVELKRRVQSLEAQLENAKKSNEKLMEEKTAMIHDLHNSQWYKDMQKSHAQRAEELKRLKIAYNRALVELTQLKNGNS